MATSTEKAVIQALLRDPQPALLAQDLFARFDSDDAILAAFVDQTLSAPQVRAVKRALAGNGALRQQWRGVLEARQAVASSRRASGRKFSPWLAWGGLGTAASLALLLSVQHQVVRESVPPLPPGTVLDAGETGAPAFAAHAVPVPAWRAFITAYDDPRADIVTDDAQVEAFIGLARQAREAEQSDCQPDSVLLLRQAFVTQANLYPQELETLKPASEADWCRLGEALRRAAAVAVISADNH